MFTSVASALAAAVMVASLSVPAEAAGPRTAGADGPKSVIISTANVVHVSEDDQYVSVRVSYRCRNTDKWVHYLSGDLSQSFNDLHYVYGYRNDSGGIRAATCTGHRVRETLQYLRSSSSWDHPEWTFEPGEAHLLFAIERRGATGVGPGWYNYQGQVTASHTVTVRLP